MAAGFKQATVNASDVPATQTNFPAYVDLSRLGITTLAEAQSVRVYADSAKTTEWAREIVSVSEMHVKIPSLTSSTVIYVDYDGVRADYAVTDTYGRNAVWSDYYAVWHMQGAAASSEKRADSTGNGRDLTEGNTPSSAAGKVGGTDGAYDVRGLATATNNSTGKDWLERPDGILDAIGTSPFTIQGWFRPDFSSTTVPWVLAGLETNGGTGRPYARSFREPDNDYNSGIEPTSSGGSELIISSIFANDTWSMFAYGRNSSNYSFGFADGSSITGAILESGAFSSGTAPFYIGRRYNTTYSSAQYYADGKFDEVRIRFSDLSGNWITTEYNNQSDEAGFWGTWTDVGGGGGSSNNSLAFGGGF